MITVYKYLLKVKLEQRVVMPRGAELLCVRMQGDAPCLWARVDTTERAVKRVIYTYGTGHVITDATAKYIDTFFVDDGIYVFHVFDGGEV